jgi:hypothetical protein
LDILRFVKLGEANAAHFGLKYFLSVSEHAVEHLCKHHHRLRVAALYPVLFRASLSYASVVLSLEINKECLIYER